MKWISRIYFRFIRSKITRTQHERARRWRDRKLAGRDYGWISSRLRGATYWTKLAHIKQGSNWNSGGIRRIPASRLARALGSAGNGALEARSRARKRNPRLRIPLFPLAARGSGSPLLPLFATSRDITPPRSLFTRLFLAPCRYTRAVSEQT